MNIKNWFRTLDYYLVLPIFFLLTISFILVYSASPVIARRLSLSQDYFIQRHMIYMILSFFSLLILSFINTRTILNLSLVSFIFFLF